MKQRWKDIQSHRMWKIDRTEMSEVAHFSLRYPCKYCVKGQLISKGLVSILNSSKTNKKFDLQYYDTSGWLVFVRFLEELKTTKSPFEINWPLVLVLLDLILWCISVMTYVKFKFLWPSKKIWTVGAQVGAQFLTQSLYYASATSAGEIRWRTIAYHPDDFSSIFLQWSFERLHCNQSIKGFRLMIILSNIWERQDKSQG